MSNDSVEKHAPHVAADTKVSEAGLWRKIWTAVAGNRVSAALNLCALFSVPSNIHSLAKEEEAGMRARHAICAIVGGAGAVAAASMSRTTLRSYLRTKQHIARFDSVEPRFFQAVMGPDINHCRYGYCQLQGMYFAMKEAGMLEEFERMKKEYTKNILPNF